MSSEGSDQSAPPTIASTVPLMEGGAEQDQLVLAQLVQLGVDPSQPRVIEHFLYFSNESAANRGAAEAAALGCETNVAPPIPEIPDWGLLCLWSVESVGIEIISAHRTALEGIASEHGGYYDGWGTPIG